MLEYKIETKASKGFVYRIWKKFLQNDGKWHYTLEGDYLELRVEKRLPELEKYLWEKNIKYISFEYIDNIPITKKYQKQFEKIFHGYSELAMVTYHWTKKEDIPKVIERCLHLVHNAMDYGLWEEAKSLAENSINRAHVAGYLQKGREVLSNAKLSGSKKG